jgi:ornithine cyclodeaminase/alanine dehydrogenase-like protein (mu-crystallin family)
MSFDHSNGTYPGILYLTRAEVEAACRGIDTVALAQEVFSAHGSDQTILPDEAYLGWQNCNSEAVRSLNMPAYVGGNFRSAGTKIINSNPANRALGLSRASGLTILFDTETGRIRCVMEATYLSALRTASVSMLAIRLLACNDCRSICIIGAGPIGVAHLELATRTFPALERISLFDINLTSAKEAANALLGREPNSIKIELAGSSESAVRSADVVIAATTVTSGYIPYDWLRPGALAINVSLDDFLPEVFLKADLIFVDDWNLVREDPRRLLGRLYREGAVSGPNQTPLSAEARTVDGEISDLVLGLHSGRRNPKDIILVNPFGLAIEDIAFAARVYEIAQQKALGMYLRV